MLSYIAEFLGTFVLLMVILKTGQALPIALGLATAIYMFGGISGGHFNPAVSLTMFVNNTLPMMDMVGYIVAQCLGGVAACYFNRL
tara:strand:- start:6994 stop:7251 length:258 start_codon:yes stop_codon:yes gene_type:complete